MFWFLRIFISTNFHKLLYCTYMCVYTVCTECMYVCILCTVHTVHSVCTVHTVCTVCTVCTICTYVCVYLSVYWARPHVYNSLCMYCMCIYVLPLAVQRHFCTSPAEWHCVCGVYTCICTYTLVFLLSNLCLWRVRVRTYVCTYIFLF